MKKYSVAVISVVTGLSEDAICLDMFGGSCNEDGYCAWAKRRR